MSYAKIVKSAPTKLGVIKRAASQPAARLVKSPARNLILGGVKTVFIKNNLTTCNSLVNQNKKAQRVLRLKAKTARTDFGPNEKPKLQNKLGFQRTLSVMLLAPGELWQNASQPVRIKAFYTSSPPARLCNARKKFSR